MKTWVSLLLFVLGTREMLAARSRVPDLQPIGITQSVTHEFPEYLARRYPNGGEARLLVTVRADGELSEWLVTGYTAPEFKQEAIAALKELKLSPARLKGEAITARSEIVLHFEVQGMIVSSSSSAEAFELSANSLFATKNEYRALPLAELDRVPAAVNVVAPKYAKELADQGIAGSVAIDFYIDEEGAVRMPAMLDPNAVALGVAAVDALRQWKFEPPLHRGKPVLARARQIFNFGNGPAVAR